tara:strand:+ start:6549 stop:7304 length:756 start_codon:yes stop_codon:yes gene_type:complete
MTYSNWRHDLSEYVDGYNGQTTLADKLNAKNQKPKTSDKSSRRITDSDIKNKIAINPSMKEAFAEIGGYISECFEIEEQSNMESSKKSSSDDKNKQLKTQQLQYQKQMMNKQLMLDKQRLQLQKQGKLPIGQSMKEGYDKPDEKLKTDRNMFSIDASERATAKARLLAKAAKKRKERMKEETGAEYHARMKEKNRKPINPYPVASKPFDPEARMKQRASQMKKNKNQDTRTDAEKMTDATGPRPGSRYRGD